MTQEQQALFDELHSMAKAAYDDGYQASRESLKQELLSDEMVESTKQAIGNALIPDGVWNIDEGFKLERAAKAALQAIVGGV